MADNTQLNLGTLGDVIASDDIAGVKFQRFKLIHGIDGINDGDVADTNPLPVKINDETHIEDTNFPAAARVFPAGAQFDDAAINAMDEDDVGALRMSANRNLYGTIRDAAGAERGVNVTAANELNVIATAQPGVDIGDVTIADGPTAGSSLSIQGAGAEASAPVGDPLLMGGDDGANVRNVAVDAAGQLQVDVLTVPAAVDLTESLAEDTNFPAAALVLPVGMQFDDAAINTLDEDDIGTPRMSANRNQYMRIRDDAGAERGVNVTAANEMNVIATAQSGVDLGDVGILDGPTGASALQGQGAGAEAAPPVGNPVLMGIDDTTNIRNLAGDSSGRILLGAGDLNIGNVDIVTGPTGASALEMQGPAAIGVAPVGDPVFMAGLANANEPTAVDDGDIVPPWLDLFGRLVTVEGHPTMEAPDNQTLTLGSQVDLIAAPGGGISIYVKAIFPSNTNATTSIRLDVKDGTTVRNSMFLTSDGGGNNRYFSGPGWKLAANTALTAELSAAHTDVRVTTFYYLAA